MDCHQLIHSFLSVMWPELGVTCCETENEIWGALEVRLLFVLWDFSKQNKLHKDDVIHTYIFRTEIKVVGVR